jgi:hypothetical protein
LSLFFRSWNRQNPVGIGGAGQFVLIQPEGFGISFLFEAAREAGGWFQRASLLLQL